MVTSGDFRVFMKLQGDFRVTWGYFMVTLGLLRVTLGLIDGYFGVTLWSLYGDFRVTLV